jgi:hypothetical protein
LDDHSSSDHYHSSSSPPEKGVEHTEHSISIIAGLYDQYNPEYVRMNPRCVVPDAHNMIQYAEDMQLGGPSAPRLIADNPKETNKGLRHHHLRTTTTTTTL